VVVVMTIISSIILWGMDRLWSTITNWLYGM
jgi:preprotein translocase subunit SecE